MATAKSNSVRLRKLWFQVHKWIGLILALPVIVLCLTGSALVWDEWLTDVANPQRSADVAASQPPSLYADAAQAVLAANERLSSLTFPDGEGAVVASATRVGEQPRGRPVRTLIWLDPADGHVLDRGDTSQGFARVLHILHGSFMIPGLGRQVVGWVGVFMLVSSLTGLWLWWPFKGGFRRGLRWKRMPTTSGNLHHQGGFWIALPLAVLSFTGAWISFPVFFGAFSGEGGGAREGGPRRFGGAPVEQVVMSPDAALAAARPLARGPVQSISWPTAPDGEWSVTFLQDSQRAEVMVADTTGVATPPEPPRPETTGRLMRRIHDGTNTGWLWQTIIFLGGLVPAGLAVTGVMMWLRGRRVKGSLRAAFARERLAGDA